MSLSKIMLCLFVLSFVVACSTGRSRNDGFDYGHIIIKQCDAGECE